MLLKFTGKSFNPVDAKGRVSLPTKYRKLLSGVDLVLVKSKDDDLPCLHLFTDEDYTEWVQSFFESVGGYKPSNLEHQHMLYGLMDAIEQVKLDASYRIRIDSDLREYAGITDKVKFIGMGSFVSILDPDVAAKISEFSVFTQL
jgi:MraZ protein